MEPLAKTQMKRAGNVVARLMKPSTRRLSPTMPFCGAVKHGASSVLLGVLQEGGPHKAAGPSSKPAPERPDFDELGRETEIWPEEGVLDDAVEALGCLVERGFFVSASLIYHVLKLCMVRKDVAVGRIIHALALKTGYQSNTFLANHIIRMYASHGMLDEVTQVFTSLDELDLFLWSSIILAHAENGQPMHAIRLYRQMRHSAAAPPDNHVFVAVLKACAGAQDLAAGKQVHADVLRSDLKANIFVSNSLVDMYSKCGNLEDARSVFDAMPRKDTVTWTAMVTGYAKCGNLEDARRLFDRMPARNLVSWNAMITGYSQHGMGQEALRLYARMQQEDGPPADHTTFASLVKACAGLRALNEGKHLHSQIQIRGLEAEVFVGNGLVDMYAKCGCVEDARTVFDRLPAKNVVTWTALIAGYAEQGLCQEALRLYTRMQEEGITPADNVTYVCLLKTCASVGALNQGKKLHSQIEEIGLETDLVVGNCLLDMYAKCGSLDDACKVFQKLSVRDVVAWNAMLAGYAQHGYYKEALQCYDRMQQAGVKPNDVTFLSILSACRHAGLVDRGVQYFESMMREHEITPGIEHYVSMVDLFGRAGCFKQVEALMLTMPMQPNLALWLCLLGACRKHGDIVLGEEAFSCAVHLEPVHSAAYLLMSHIYAGAGISEHATELHMLREKQGGWKEPGQSWIEHEQEVHTFLVGDGQHPQHEELYDFLAKVRLQLQKEGHGTVTTATS